MTNSEFIKQLFPNSENIYFVIDGKIIHDRCNIPKFKNVFIFQKVKGGIETIKGNVKIIIRFNFQYKIGDILAKLYMFISQKLDININNINIQNKVNKSIIEPFKSIQQCWEEDNQGIKVVIHHKAVNDINVTEWVNLIILESYDLVDVNITQNHKQLSLKVCHRLKFETLYMLINFKFNAHYKLISLENNDKATDPLQRIRKGNFVAKEIKLKEVKIIKVHEDNMIINADINSNNTIQDLKGVMSARFSFSCRLQYHDAFGQILCNNLILKDIMIKGYSYEGKTNKIMRRKVFMKML
jgi:hypothetical protein